MSIGESTPVRGGLPATMVIMVTMRILVEEFLCQGLTGWRSVLESYSLRRALGSAAMSCHARLLNGVASPESGGHGACLVLKSPRVMSRVCNERIGGKILFVHDHGE
jgi:hypothetical protein